MREIKPLDFVPFNTKKQYVMAVTKSGCEIYMPVDSYDESVLMLSKINLQKQLDNEYSHTLDIPPSAA